MKRRLLYIFALCFSFLLAPSAAAHVSLLYPRGQEVFAPGQEVIIQWQEVIPHTQIDWDLYFSTDGGATWEVLKEGIAVDELTYAWIVPDLMTDEAQIRVVQDNEDVDYEDQSGDFEINDMVTAIDRPDDVQPSVISAFTSYPNPFTDATTLEFTLAQAAPVTIEVFNLLGERVKGLANTTLAAGTHHLRWSPDNQPSGVYLVRIQSGSHIETRKLIRME